MKRRFVWFAGFCLALAAAAAGCYEAEVYMRGQRSQDAAARRFASRQLQADGARALARLNAAVNANSVLWADRVPPRDGTLLARLAIPGCTT